MARPSITQLPPTGLDRFRGLLTRADDLTGGLLAAVPGIGTLAALNRAGNAAQSGDYTKAVESLTDVIPVGRLASNAIRGITRGRSAGDISGVLNVTKEQFLGDPKITSNKNASGLVPKELVPTRSMQAEPFKNGMTAKYSPSGATVYDADGKVVASYNNGDTLVVGKDSRKQGIGEELVYQWRTRFPDAPPAKERTKASQALQEKVWDRITKERPDLVGIQGGLLGSSTDSRALNQFEYPQQAALDTAQRNAALPVDQGGLGLRPDNTPMERAKAIGNVIPAYRGTNANEKQLKKSPGMVGDANYSGIYPEIAENYAAGDGANIMPLLIRGPLAGNLKQSEIVGQYGWKALPDQLARQGYTGVADEKYEDAIALTDLSAARSRFAAFDPMRRNEADLLAFRGNMGGTTLGNINPLLGLLDDENQ